MATPPTTRSLLPQSVRRDACPVSTQPPDRPRRLRGHRRVVAGFGAIALAVPLSFALAGSSQAAPTLTVAQAQAQLAALQVQEDVATEAFDAGTIAAHQATTAATSAQAAVTRQSRTLDGMQKRIASFAAASYTTGGLNPLDSLLAGGDPATMLSKAASMNEVARNQNSKVVAITAQREVLAGAQRTAGDKARAASIALKTLTAARDHITGVIAQEQSVLAHLQAQQRAALLAAEARQQAASRAQARAALTQFALTRHAQAVALSAPAHAAAPTRAAAPTSSSATHQSSPPPARKSSGGVGQSALAAAYSQMGKPYSYGGAGPSSYDCSGLTMWAFARAGVSLPHSAAGQYGYGTHVSRGALQPGDLVFFNEGGGIGHVGIYVGGGSMIDANHTGGWVGVRPLYGGFVGGTRL